MLFSACHDKIWDAIDDLDARVAKLEELCKEMNTNISSLQTIVSVIQENDYITGILPIEKGGETIGYTITFGKHDPITIYNGEDGKDGTNGSNGQGGYTPILGVAKDTDGIYYWTLNGEWLLDAEGNKVRVTGEDGKNGADGKDGQDGIDGENGENGVDGQPGKDGANGKDGITPKLKIENGYWYVSYDNEVTWIELGKAVGENGEDGKNGQDGKPGTDGQPGRDGVDGDSMFTNVTYDENNVYFTLTNGTILIVPRGNTGESGEVNPSDIIKFEDLNVKSALMQMNIDTNEDGEISYGEAASYKGKMLLKNNTDILSFKEFQYFTGISTRIGNGTEWSTSIVEFVSFDGCSNLFEITFPNTIDTIGASAFRSCSKLKRIILPESLVCIGQSAFRECTSLSEISIPENVEYIGEGAFYRCSLKQFTYPKNLKTINIPFVNSYSDGDNTLTSVFWNCENEIELYYCYYGDDDYKYYGLAAVGYYSPNKTLIPNISSITFGEHVTSIPNYLCQYTKIESIEIPNHITKIGKYAFRKCTNLKNIKFSENVDTIKEYTFFACTALTSVTIPDNIRSIEKDAFSSCSALTSVTIGNGVISIGNSAFYGCSSLYLVYSKNPIPPTLGNYVFNNTKIGIIYVPKASVDVYKAAWSDYADKIVGYDF